VRCAALLPKVSKFQLQTATEIVAKNNRRSLQLSRLCRSLEEEEQGSEIVTWCASISMDDVEGII
jgi:hypothetical protein